LELIAMSLNVPSEYAASHAQLVDAVIEGYVSWREESAAVTATYERWCSAANKERSNAFQEYVAALDREERAASAYQHLLADAAA
jgi:hypothetical protein